MNEYYDESNNEHLDEKDKEKEILDSDSTYYEHWKSILRQVFYYYFNSIKNESSQIYCPQVK